MKLEKKERERITEWRRDGSELGSLEKLESLAVDDSVLRCISQSLSTSAIVNNGNWFQFGGVWDWFV